MYLNEEPLHYKELIYVIILQVFCHLPLHKALPVHISAILQSVNNLRFYRNSGMILSCGVAFVCYLTSALCWERFYELPLDFLSVTVSILLNLNPHTNKHEVVYYVCVCVWKRNNFHLENGRIQEGGQVILSSGQGSYIKTLQLAPLCAC